MLHVLIMFNGCGPTVQGSCDGYEVSKIAGRLAGAASLGAQQLIEKARNVLLVNLARTLF